MCYDFVLCMNVCVCVCMYLRTINTDVILSKHTVVTITYNGCPSEP